MHRRKHYVLARDALAASVVGKLLRAEEYVLSGILQLFGELDARVLADPLRAGLADYAVHVEQRKGTSYHFN